MIFLFTLVMPAYALTIPVFPSCTIPQGTVKAQFGQGTHGIVGSTDTFIGSDSVFTLTEDTLLQCFCPEIGTDGIQTNWWRATGLTDNDIQILKNQGWFFIPNGALWGLAADPFVAQNINFSCVGGVGGGEILGLAATGGAWQPYLYVLGGLGLTILGLALVRKWKQN